MRVALVTGAASGIGAAIARRLSASGAVVVCADLDVGGAVAEADRIARDGGRARGVGLDVADESTFTEVVEVLDHELAGLDVLVNCAGISVETPLTGLDMATHRRVLDVNLNGAVALVLRLLPLLRASESARILNIASVQGLRGTPGSLSYATSKGGMVNLTRALAADLAGDSILVNALAPGFIDTPMALLPDGSSEYETDWFRDVYVRHQRIPLRRPGTAEEVAAAAEYFCSPENTYVTGQVLAVDGGLTAVL